MASLALIHNATSTGSESSLMEIMRTIIDMTPGFTGQDPFAHHLRGRERTKAS
jgi:hypothetical protein